MQSYIVTLIVLVTVDIFRLNRFPINSLLFVLLLQIASTDLVIVLEKSLNHSFVDLVLQLIEGMILIVLYIIDWRNERRLFLPLLLFEILLDTLNTLETLTLLVVLNINMNSLTWSLFLVLMSWFNTAFWLFLLSSWGNSPDSMSWGLRELSPSTLRVEDSWLQLQFPIWLW